MTVSQKDAAHLNALAEMAAKGHVFYAGDAERDDTEESIDMEWKTIDSAPKDDTPVLVWGDCSGWRGQFARVCATYSQGQWRIYGPILGEPNGDGKTRQWLGEIHPTHWMPLPEPPSKGA